MSESSVRHRLLPFRLSKLATLTGATLAGDDIEISGAAGLDDAAEGEITFLRKGKSIPHDRPCRAAALILAEGIDDPRPQLIHSNPRWVFSQALALLLPEERPTPGVHPTAVVSPTARIGEGCAIGPFVVIEDEAEIGPRTRIASFAVIERRVKIGADCRLDPHVVVYRDCIVGDRCTLFAGATIGCDGFGFEVHDRRIWRMNHIGITVLEDDVEIGARTCVDRGTTGQTRVGQSTKIDNLVMIGHNCTIGRGSMLAGMTGLAGSTTVGNGCFLGGNVGTADHSKIGDGAKLAARSGVWSEVPAGVEWSGYPARDHRTEMRELMSIPKLPQLLKDVRALTAEVERLRGLLEERQP